MTIAEFFRVTSGRLSLGGVVHALIWGIAPVAFTIVKTFLS